MISRAKRLDIQTQHSVIWTQVQADCCSVTQIAWSNLNHYGILNNTASLSKLQNLALKTTTWPIGLQILDFRINQLTGSIPSS